MPRRQHMISPISSIRMEARTMKNWRLFFNQTITAVKRGIVFIGIIIAGWITGNLISTLSGNATVEAKPPCNNLVCGYSGGYNGYWYCYFNWLTSCNLYDQGAECGTNDTCHISPE